MPSAAGNKQRKKSARSGAHAPRERAPSARPPGLQLRAVDVLARFRVIFRSARQHYIAVERELGITGAQLRALAIIAAQRQSGVTALANALHVRQPTASKLVEQLVTLGYVRRRRSTVDQRVIELSATPRAGKLLKRTPGPLTGVLADALDSLPPSQLLQLGRALDALLDAMRLRDDRAGYVPLADL